MNEVWILTPAQRTHLRLALNHLLSDTQKMAQENKDGGWDNFYASLMQTRAAILGMTGTSPTGRRRKAYFIRGLPGAGKSTFGAFMVQMGLAKYQIEADQFHMVDGKYEWKGENVPHAHRSCQELLTTLLKDGHSVIVANTFSTTLELHGYRVAAYNAGVDSRDIVEIDLYDGGFDDETLVSRNVHNVPLETIQRMRSRWSRRV